MRRILQERLSPLTEEFEYVGDGAYDRNMLLTMEQNILRCVNYELSFPISYSFLRRYARVIFSTRIIITRTTFQEMFYIVSSFYSALESKCLCSL